MFATPMSAEGATPTAAFNPYAHADASEEVKTLLARKMLAISGLESALARLLVTGLADASSQFSSGSHAMHDQPIDPALIEEITRQIGSCVSDSVDGLSNRMAPIFAEEFSTDELIRIITFYKSSAGQKLAGTLPQVAARRSAA